MSYSQDQINGVWKEEWLSQFYADSRTIFRHRLCIEGYPVFKKFIPADIQRILEIGSGSGRYGLQVARDFPHSKVYITDIVDESLHLARKVAKEINLDNVVFKREDLFLLSFEDSTFDCVICDVVIQHLPNYKESLKEMHRVLKPGGRILLTVNNYLNLPHTLLKFIRGKKYEYGFEKSFTRGELARLLEENKFTVRAIDGYYAAYGIYRLKKYWKGFKLLGKIMNRGVKIVDRFTNRFISKTFGFVLLGVGIKKNR